MGLWFAESRSENDPSCVFELHRFTAAKYVCFMTPLPIVSTIQPRTLTALMSAVTLVLLGLVAGCDLSDEETPGEILGSW